MSSKECNRRWYLKNKEKKLQQCKLWKKQNAVKCVEYAKAKEYKHQKAYQSRNSGLLYAKSVRRLCLRRERKEATRFYNNEFIKQWWKENRKTIMAGMNYSPGDIYNMRSMTRVAYTPAVEYEVFRHCDVELAIA